MMDGENESFGLHYLKFFMAVMILFVHELVFSSLAVEKSVDIRNPALLHLMAFIPSSYLVPMAAGAVQAIALRSQLTTGKLVEFKMGPFIKIALALAFIESLKAAIVYMPSVFFGWNVLHFLALALTLVLFLARLSVHWVWISAVACLALTPWMQDFLGPFQIQNYGQVTNVNEYGLDQFFKLILTTGAFGFFIVWVSKRPNLEMKFKLRLYAVTLVSGVLILSLAMRTTTNPYFASRILNLPAGILVGDKMGMHYWPFFPWYACVAFGFCFYYGLSQLKWPKAYRIGSACAAVTGLVIHFSFLEQNVIAQLDAREIWGASLFGNALNLMVFSFSSFVLFALGFERIATAPLWHRACEKVPLLWRVPFVYSKTILWSYLFINIFGGLLARPFTPILGRLETRAVFSLLIAAAWYWPGAALMRWLARTRITVRFRAANG